VALMGDVVELDVDTTLPIPSDRLLRAALEGDVSDVVILGYGPDGKLWFSSADPDPAQVLWLLELGKRFLLNNYAGDGDED
jgi:hypothetical protein